MVSIVVLVIGSSVRVLVYWIVDVVSVFDVGSRRLKVFMMLLF